MTEAALARALPLHSAPTARKPAKDASGAHVPCFFSMDETMEIGCDAGKPVSPDCGLRNNVFSGRIKWVQIDIDAAAKDVDHMIGAEGVLVCCGGLTGGFTVFIKDNKLYWELNYYGQVHYRVVSTGTIAPGRQVLSAGVKVDGRASLKRGGTVTLLFWKKDRRRRSFREADRRFLYSQ